MSIFLILVLELGIRPESPDLVIGDQYLEFPQDALYWNERFYVATGGFRILVFQKGEPVSWIGRRGKGPGEFSAMPARLNLVDGRLEVTESHGHRVSYFDREGNFVKRENREQNFSYFYGSSRRNLETSTNPLYRLYDGDQDCFLLKLAGDSDQDFYSSRFQLLDYGPRLIVLQNAGTLSLYSQGCSLERQISLRTGPFYVDPIHDQMGSGILRNYEKMKGKQFKEPYLFGLPILDAALQDHFLWILVQNENKAGPRGEPQETWLYKLDLVSEAFEMVKLERVVSRVRFSNGVLLLLYPHEARVAVFFIRS